MMMVLAMVVAPRSAHPYRGPGASSTGASATCRRPAASCCSAGSSCVADFDAA